MSNTDGSDESWTIYVEATGEVALNYKGHAAPTSYDIKPGQSAVEGEYAWDKYHFAEGVPVAYSAEQAAAKDARPPWARAWSNATMSWLDPRSLVQLKADKWEAMKDARTAEERAPFEWDGSTFDADSEKINGAVTAALIATANNVPYEVEWTLADNTTRVLSAADMIAVGMALVGRVAAAHAKGRTVRAAIEAADATELEAIKWPAT